MSCKSAMLPSYVECFNVRLGKAKAFERFELFDRDTVTLSPSSPGQEIRLSPGTAVIITGYIPFNAIRFSVNLSCNSSADNVALHFNPRLQRGYVVRNSKLRNQWQEEERCSSSGRSGFLFHRDTYFHLMIFCTPNEYQIAIDGEHFCSFAYRIPLAAVTVLQVQGDVEDVRTRVTTFKEYPDSELYPPKHNLELFTDKPLNNNLDIPVTVSIPEGITVGTRISVKGRLKLLPHSFYLNLQKGRTIYPHPEIGLHLNPRFLFGSAEPCVVMNCWKNGSWEHEERHEGVLSWGPGREFVLTLACEYEAYTIWLGSKMIGEFRHRVSLESIDTIKICGDVVIYELYVTHTP
ncbi:galectin-6-like isoform X1 [Diprion similis]|uniref:galectin-6-like isoform X1 n=1 Tax=Diprion similis TaxID=362088 RepID=UPI001EF9215F|nr:galectin-6-like isoform X1 [Diprion similis]